MADPNGRRRRLPAGDPGRLNLGSAPASSASAATSASSATTSAAADFAPSSRDIVYVPFSRDIPLLPIGEFPQDRVNLGSASAAGDAIINSAGAPAGAHQYMTNPYAGDAMINSSALAGAHPHMVNPPPYAGASSSRLPTASAEWNMDWLHDAMAEQQQPLPITPSGSRSIPILRPLHLLHDPHRPSGVHADAVSSSSPARAAIPRNLSVSRRSSRHHHPHHEGLLADRNMDTGINGRSQDDDVREIRVARVVQRRGWVSSRSPRGGATNCAGEVGLPLVASVQSVRHQWMVQVRAQLQAGGAAPWE
uniref:Uncharacterized protein n=1 Tax=Oryza meridionalis TaxID=40149 RepID=A0A0E0C114_9ORYZ